MIYQMIIRELNRLRNEGIDIGNAIHYCTENIFDLVEMYDSGLNVDELLSVCMNNK